MSIENENELEFNEAESEIEQDQPEQEVVDEPSEPEEYEPNYSYKVKDEEFEFDEVLRESISNREAEEKLRELYTKSAGLDSYKGRYNELVPQTEALVSGYKTIKELRDKGDYRELFNVLGLPQEAVLKYTDELLAEHEMPEEQREAIQRNRELESKLRDLENRVSGYDEQVGNQRIQDEVRELETLITSDTFLPVAQAMKSVGINMQDEVLSAGYMEFARTGKEPSVKSVVQNVAQKYSYLTKNREAEAKPTLPSVNKTNASSAGTRIKSIDDLRKLASSKF